jgi:hypothetical protein
LEYQSRRLLVGKLEHEIRRKSLLVALDGLVQVAGRDTVKHGQVCVQQHFLPAGEVDQPLDLLSRDQLCHSLAVHGLIGLKCQIGISKQVSLEWLASSRATLLSFELWLRKTSYLKSFAIPASAEWGETDAFAGQKQK